MTISRKEFEWYTKALAEIQGDAMRLRNLGMFARRAEKEQLFAEINRNCTTLREVLAARVSKPRPRNPVEIVTTGSYDA